MELAGLQVAQGESVSEWEVNVKASDVLSTTVDIINILCLGYTIFIKIFFLQNKLTLVYVTFFTL